MTPLTDRAFWDAVAPDEEIDRGDEAINRALRWREIERHLAGVRTVLDIGAGTGAFSIPLARRGLAVTHLDVSPAMIAAARRRAGALATLTFVEASAADLSRFADRSFDLVLNLDGAISFAGPQGAAAVLAETCRVARRTVIVTVSNRACMVATWLKYSLQATGRILPAVHAMMRTGGWDHDQFPDNALLYPGVCDLPRLQSFTRDELAAALTRQGLTVLAARALGSLTHLLLPHGLDAAATDDFVALCEAFDSDLLPDGPGSFRRAGLLAVAARPDESIAG